MTVSIQFLNLLREHGAMGRLQLQAASGRTAHATRSVLAILIRKGHVVNVATKKWPAIYDLSEAGRTPEALLAWRDARSTARARVHPNRSIVAQAIRGAPNSVWALGDQA